MKSRNGSVDKSNQSFAGRVAAAAPCVSVICLQRFQAL